MIPEAPFAFPRRSRLTIAQKKTPTLAAHTKRPTDRDKGAPLSRTSQTTTPTINPSTTIDTAAVVSLQRNKDRFLIRAIS